MAGVTTRSCYLLFLFLFFVFFFHFLPKKKLLLSLDFILSVFTPKMCSIKNLLCFHVHSCHFSSTFGTLNLDLLPVGCLTRKWLAGRRRESLINKSSSRYAKVSKKKSIRSLFSHSPPRWIACNWVLFAFARSILTCYTRKSSLSLCERDMWIGRW